MLVLCQCIFVHVTNKIFPVTIALSKTPSCPSPIVEVVELSPADMSSDPFPISPIVKVLERSTCCYVIIKLFCR